MYVYKIRILALPPLVRTIHVRVRVRVPHVAMATVRRRGLVEEIRYHHHYGVCKTFVVAAAYCLPTTSLLER